MSLKDYEENDYDYEDEEDFEEEIRDWEKDYIQDFEEMEIVLLVPMFGALPGEIIKVTRGVYNTLIDLKKGLPFCLYDDEIEPKQKLLAMYKQTAKELEECQKDMVKAYETIEKLERKIKKLKDVK